MGASRVGGPQASAKAATYQPFFNSKRKNRWKENRTPLDLIKQLDLHIDADRVTSLRPISLPELIEDGYHTPASPNSRLNSA